MFKLYYINNNVSVNLHSINQVSSATLTNNKTFLDIQSHWCQKLIENMASKNLITGINATTFAPNRAIKKSEFITLVTRILNSQQIVDNLVLTMDNKDWSNTLNDTLSRNEAAEFITKLYVYLNNTSMPTQTSVSYSDINDKNSTIYVNYATTLNLLSGYRDGTFKSNKSLSRAESVKILSNLLDLNIALL